MHRFVFTVEPIMSLSSFLRPAALLSGALIVPLLATGCGGGGGSSSGSNAISATNSITFVSSRDGNNELYVMKPDGTSQTRLTTSPGDDLSPSKSRDGRRIVFQSNRDGNNEIYIMNFDGSGLQRLTADSGANAPDDTQPVLSPDGNTIAWTSTRSRGDDTDIWLMDSTGANQRRFTTSTGTEGTSNPVFSPDGLRIAFVASGPRQRYRDETLAFKNVAGGAVTKANFTSYSIRHPRFNPAGTRIVFSDQIPNTNLGRIRIYDIASQTVVLGPTAGANSVAESPDYSPTGTSIVWNVSGGATTGNTPTGQIYRANEDGTNQQVITSVGNNSGADW
jgi:Tol biopolymer transport system component